MPIRKAIIPVAGFGTRFLPATKAQPKEMLTLVDKPVIQYIVEEAVAAGIEQIIFVTNQTKRAIEDHFDRNFELEYRLKKSGKEKELAAVMALTDLVRIAYLRQRSPKGDGDAILQARSLIGDEPCAVLYGDDVVYGDRPCIGQIIAAYERHRAPVMAIEQVPLKDIHRYGVIAGKPCGDGDYIIEKLVEKPPTAEAPSDLAVIGRYVITPDVFDRLSGLAPSPDGEIHLTDAFNALMRDKPVYAQKFIGKRYDCGNKLEFLKAQVDFGLRHAEVNGDGRFGEFLKSK